jgi:hypothetical protein
VPQGAWGSGGALQNLGALELMQGFWDTLGTLASVLSAIRGKGDVETEGLSCALHPFFALAVWHFFT